eukprot:UC4_evm1s761
MEACVSEDSNGFQYPARSDYTFFLGDLNFRVDKNSDIKNEKNRKTNEKCTAEILESVDRQDWASLLKHDQLSNGKKRGDVLDAFSEMSISFPPTFKGSKGKADDSNGSLSQ